MHRNNSRMIILEEKESGERSYRCHCGTEFVYNPETYDNVAPDTEDGDKSCMCPTCGCVRAVSLTNDQPEGNDKPLRYFKSRVVTSIEDPSGMNEGAEAYGFDTDLAAFFTRTILSLPFPRDLLVRIEVEEVTKEEFEQNTPPPELTGLLGSLLSFLGGRSGGGVDVYVLGMGRVR